MSGTPEGETVEHRLSQVVEELGIPSSTLQITQVRLNRLGTEPDVDDDRMDEVAAAALALSAREDGLPVTENEIADAWSGILESTDIEATVSHDQLSKQLKAVAEYLDIGSPPAHPGDLIREFGEQEGMSDRLIEVAHRILHDAYDIDSTVVAGGTSPSGTAGAVLYLAAETNDLDDEFTQDSLGDTSGTSAVTVRNRYRELRDLLGDERLGATRYQLDSIREGEAAGAETEESVEAADQAETEESAESEPGGGPEPSAEPDATETPTASETATDGNGNAEAASGGADSGERTETADAPSGGSTPSGGTASEEEVEAAVDELTDELDIDPSVRLFAQGMVGDASEDVPTEDSDKLAGAALVAGARINEAELDAVDIADQRGFQSREIAGWLDHLDEVVDVDIPRRSADEIVAQLVEELDLSEEVLEESQLALEQYQAEEIDAEYTAAELGAGAVFFAATVGRTQVDIQSLSDITGAGTEYITDAMNSVVVSLCRSLVRGDIDYESTSWTTDLLESELSPDIGDSYTGRVIAIAKTYTAGRESQHVDDATLDVLLTAE